MIPLFPKFTTLRIEHKTEVEKITRQFEPYSDFNFVSLFCWNTDGKTQVSKLNGNLVVKFKDYTSDKVLHSIIGNNDIDKSLNSLSTVTNSLSLVPEVVIKSITESKFKAEEQKDNFDYVYLLSDLAELKGGHYKKKRNRVNQFTNDLGELATVQTKTKLGEDDVVEVEAVIAQWCFETGKTQDQICDEKDAILTAVKNLKALSLYFTELRIRDRLKGFSIHEIIDDKYAICHFEKTIKAHGSIGPFLIKQAAGFLVEKGCELVNWEQDLGLDGLRRAKRSYLHTAHLKKYIVEIQD